LTRFLRYLPVAIGLLSVTGLPGEAAAMGLGRPEPIMGPHAADPGRLREVIELGSEQIVPPPTPEQAAFISRVCTKIEAAAQAYALPPAFLARLIWTESRFDPDAISPMGAEGIAQFMPSTAKVWGLENPFEPMTAITASAYNAGEKRVDACLKGRSGLPGETRGYVYAITGHSAYDWKKKNPPDVRFVPQAGTAVLHGQNQSILVARSTWQSLQFHVGNENLFVPAPEGVKFRVAEGLEIIEDRLPFFGRQDLAQKSRPGLPQHRLRSL
jgi:hypothetical protein